tara:strand:+ start:242 stop:343 length:102 start_codon:yes stop_codon:yes gene_type:complete
MKNYIKEKDNNIKIIEQNTNNHMLIWGRRIDNK